MEQQRQQQQMAHQHPLQHQHSHRSLQSPPQAHSQTIQQNQNQMSHHPHLQQHFQNQQNPQSHDQFPNQQMHHLHSHTQHGGNPILARSNTFPMENQSCQEYEHSDQHPQQQQIQHDHQQQQYCVGSPVMTTSKNFQQHHYQPQQQQQQLQSYHQVSNYQQNSTNYHHSQNVQAYNDRNYGAAPPTPPVVMGPRSKCDQVIFEAMTKACEIAVRGRCTDLVDASMNLPRGFGGIGGGMHGHGHGIAGGNDARKTRGSPYPSSYSSSSPGGQQQRNGAANTANGNGSNSSLGSTSSRFNIEVEEVEEVRVVLQRWKQSLNVPLRLDIYYEHDSCYDEDLNCDIKDGGGENFAERSQKPPQRELLERWCIDYVPSYHQQMGITNDKSSNIAQLRQVCKRIVVLLRSLHCLTRILPAYRLKSLLLLHASNGSTVVNGGISAGNNGIGVSDGWGSIGYSIYVSDYEPEAPALPSPAFTRQSFPNVPTPHGTLCMSVMYDATLHPNHMVADLAERRAQWIQRRWIAQRSGHTVTQEYMEVGNATGTMPIPIQGRQYSEPVVTSNGFPQREFTNNERRHFGSCPPATMIGGGAQYNPNTNSLGKSPAVSDFIIQDYHGDRSPSLKPASSPGVGGIVHTMNDTEDGNAVGDKRVMSGLSLAMMADDENSSKNGGHRPSHPSTPEELPENQDVSILRWQPSATRAAFHHPPPTYTDSPLEEDDAAPNLTDSQLQQAHSSGTDRTALNLMKQGTHFFHSHSGYGYGYNGSQVSLMSETPNGEGTAPIRIESVGTRTSSNNSAGDYGLSISPSPLMSTPPQTMWMKSRPPPATSKLNNDKSNGCADTDKESTSYSSQGIAPPFQNPTSLQPLPSPSSTHCGSTSTTAHTTAHGDPDGGINSQHKHSGLGKSSDVHKKRSPSSSSVLLPPVTSLDLLQKSPFSAARMHGAKSSMNGGDKDLADDRRLEDDDLMMPFMLGSYRDDGFTSSIPRMVSASSRGRSGSSGGSMTGIGGSISLMPSLDGGYSHSGGYYSTYYSSGPGANMEPTSTLLEEMPFAVDDDPLMSGASSPFGSVGKSSRSLLNGPNAFDGSNSHGVAEITSSLAVSSLHHRCGDEGKPRLKLFGSAHTMQSRGLSMLNKDGSDEVAENAENDQMQDFASIKDQLSDFRNFAGSLMVGSVHDSRSE